MSSPKVSRAGAEWQEPGQRRALGKLQHHQLRASPESRRCSDGRVDGEGHGQCEGGRAGADADADADACRQGDGVKKEEWG